MCFQGQILQQLLGLENDDLTEEEHRSLESSVEIARYCKEEVIVHEETTDRNCLFLVMSGYVSVSQKCVHLRLLCQVSPTTRNSLCPGPPNLRATAGTTLRCTRPFLEASSDNFRC